MTYNEFLETMKRGTEQTWGCLQSGFAGHH